MSTLPGANKAPSQNPHYQVEARIFTLFAGIAMLAAGTKLWVNILGGVFVVYAILRILWRDVYKAATL